MKRPDIETIKALSRATPEFEMFTEETGLSITCKDSDRQAIKNYINDSDGYNLLLIQWIEHLEREIDCLASQP